MAKDGTETDGGDPGLLGQLLYVARLARAERQALLRGARLHAGQDAVLAALAEEDGLAMGRLAARLGVRPPTATKMVARMEARGLVRRGGADGDRRRTFVFLSEQGSRAVAQAEEARRKGEKAAFSGLKDKDCRRLAKILAKIRRSLEKPGSRGAQGQ
jgi:DNA-binding MarR family transcriptional regulator